MRQTKKKKQKEMFPIHPNIYETNISNNDEAFILHFTPGVVHNSPKVGALDP